MDNTKFTKGKWVIGINDDQTVLTDNGAYRPNAMQITTSTKIELKANALLISKSPELLEALYKLLKWSAHFPPAMNDELEVANKLIKEATEIK